MLTPLIFDPIYRHAIWGGDLIHRHLARNLPPSGRAESWEIADRKEGSTVLCRGPLEGLSLTELMRSHSAEIMGAGYEGPFPFLAKLIDAREALSFQVHPNEESAWRHGGEAKSEAWYILATEGEAHIWLGKREGVSVERAKKSLVEGGIREVARQQAVSPGDVYYVPGGLLHAI
ncbi:MAG: type I phosphomannose isomerase catalytic subunit, partial [Chlamydiota bacterium]|nr:type I phosphomannose isomerase catalytic subunit [Chlamydiota bacterium]